ncbi:hypothetical protein VP01_1316g3 [Puccinia sorghi]|uniref:Uncharacterized protein n=1 Tax=Puccinia sorghi TaxID=27349 RepID=A0A0L6VMR1_9BASI|nr:hypothetical protein VP01_1316g3 [Puccinia sorghi]
MQIKHLNDELKPFNFLTKEMEGDGPTYFKKKEAASSRITKLEEYQEEALECEVLMMANLLHPEFCLRFFAHCWPEREKARVINSGEEFHQARGTTKERTG